MRNRPKPGLHTLNQELTSRRNALWSLRVIGPGLPLPIFRPLTPVMGMISEPVPSMRSSWNPHSSLSRQGWMVVRMDSSWARESTTLRVTLGKVNSVSGGAIR